MGGGGGGEVWNKQKDPELETVCLNFYKEPMNRFQKEPIPPAYVALWAGTTTLVILYSTRFLPP